MLRYPLATIILWSIIVLSGCSTLRNAVETNSLPYNKRDRYTRFAFVRHSDSLHNEIDVPFRQLVEQVVTQQLTYRGYQFDPLHPDFVITSQRFDQTTDLDIIDLQATRRVIDMGLPESHDVARLGIIRRHRIVKGNVMLQVYDVSRKQLICHGYTKRVQPVAIHADEPDAHTRYLVQTVIDSFPFHAAALARNEARVQ